MLLNKVPHVDLHHRPIRSRPIPRRRSVPGSSDHGFYKHYLFFGGDSNVFTVHDGRERRARSWRLVASGQAWTVKLLVRSTRRAGSRSLTRDRHAGSIEQKENMV
jgi:hypothetical protein